MKMIRLLINILLSLILWILLTAQLSDPVDDFNATDGQSKNVNSFFQSF